MLGRTTADLIPDVTLDTPLPPLIVMMAMMVTMTMMAMAVRLHPSGEDQTARSTDVILDTPHHDDGHDDDDVDEDLSEWRRPDC